MHHLKTLIYHLLLEKPQTGYGLAKKIQEKTGWKPSWGSIYPQLDNMQKNGSLSVKQKGRTKIYSLTKQGKEEAKKHLEETTQLLDEILQRIHVLQHFTSMDVNMIVSYFHALKKGEEPFAPILKETKNVDAEFARLWKKELLKENKEQINNILKQATKQLREIK